MRQSMRAAFVATAIAFAGLVDDSLATKMTPAGRQTTPPPGGDPPSQLAEGSQTGQPGQLASLPAPPAPRAELVNLPGSVLRKLIGDFLAGNAGDSPGRLQHASKALRSTSGNCLEPLELDPRRVQRTIEAGDWETGWETVRGQARSDRGVVIAAIEAGVIESCAEIFPPPHQNQGDLLTRGDNLIPVQLLRPGGPRRDDVAGDQEQEVDEEDVVVAAIRKGLVTDPATQLGQKYALCARVTAALLRQSLICGADAELWNGDRGTDLWGDGSSSDSDEEDIMSAAYFRGTEGLLPFLDGPTLSPEVLAAVLRRDDIMAHISRLQIPAHILETSAEVLAVTIHRWWGPHRSFGEIPEHFRSGATASGAVVGAAIEKQLRGAPASLDEVRRLGALHLHHHDDIILAGLRREPAWFQAWGDLPEAAKGSVRVIAEIYCNPTAQHIFTDLARRIGKGEVEGAHARWGSLVRMPARTDVRLLREALRHIPELFHRSWDADVPRTARRDLECMLSAMDSGLVGKNVANPPATGLLLATVSHALHVPAAVVRSENFVIAAIKANLLQQWADVPVELRGSARVVSAVVEHVRERTRFWWWWQESVHEMRQEEVAAVDAGGDISSSQHFSNFADFRFFRDVQEPAASDKGLIKQAILAFGRETLDAWAAGAHAMDLRARVERARLLPDYFASLDDQDERNFYVLKWLRRFAAEALGLPLDESERYRTALLQPRVDEPEDAMEKERQRNNALHALPEFLRQDCWEFLRL